MRRFGQALCVVCCGLFTAATASADVSRFALVIGNNRPDHQGKETLRYADDDAAATHRVMREAGIDSVLLVRPDEESKALIDPKEPSGAPRIAELEAAFAGLVSRMRAAEARGETTEFVLVYSGHGDVDQGEGYVALEDARLTRTRLFELLSRTFAARNHVFIDACKSYFLAFDRGPGGSRSRHTGAIMARVPANLANTGFVLSTSSDRESHEWERYHGGILSHELRSALRGAADTNLDARVDYRELGAFLTQANRGIQNPRFRPDFLVRAPHGDLSREIVRWRAGAATVSVGPSDFGHFYLENQEGERLLDAHPKAGQKLALYMPRERPLFLRRADGSSEFRVDDVRPVQVTTLVPSAPETKSRGAIGLAFEQLFSVPFGAEDVSSFTPSRERIDELPQRTRAERMRRASGTVAVVGLTAGGLLSGAALATFLAVENADQRTLKRTNELVPKLYYASLGGVGVFALAGSVWAYAKWSKRMRVEVALGDGIGVTVDGRF